MAKATHGISVTRNTDKMIATFQLVNKTEETIEDELTLKWDDVHPDCQDFVKLYGMTKLVQDRESGAEMLEKLEAYSSCFNDTLAAGILNRERKSGGPTVRIEVEALAKLKGVTVKQAQTLLRKYDKDQQATILGSDQVSEMVKTIQAETKDETGDLDDLL